VPGNNNTSAAFLFDTLDGTISAWNFGVDRNNAKIKVTTPGAVYTGLAIDSTPGQAPLLYAANWAGRSIDVFDQNFAPAHLTGNFTDPNIPSSYHPFNVQELGGLIYVTYAKFDPTTGVDAAGHGHGFVDVFTRDGVLQKFLVAHNHLDSPWGLAMAPQGFGNLGGDLLVGNFGDGTIHAFNPNNGDFVGTLRDASGHPIAIENLWALRFGNGGGAGSTNTLFFTAGLTDDPAKPFGADDGLIGSLQAVPHLHRSAPLLPNLTQGTFQSFSTVPPNGDVNPYGVAFVPPDFNSGNGPLQPGDVLVSNFNASSNLQGTGTTIVRITPAGQRSVFFQGSAGLGLTTALGVLRSGFVLVGNVPTSDGTFATIQQGSLLILNNEGTKVAELQDSHLLNGPWDLTVNDHGDRAQVFVANVLSGTVTRIDLAIRHGQVQVLRMTQIASGYLHEPNMAALEVGPTGLAYDPNKDLLYVASTDDNAIFAIPHAGTTRIDQGRGQVVFQDATHLHGPLALALLPNGNLITANGDAVNADPNQPSELVEFTPSGQFVGQFMIDPNPGGAFGLAVSSAGGVLRFAAVNDNSLPPSLNVWTFDLGQNFDGPL
jgi:uncharacterized protein (TIGR03118 family)